MSSVAAQGRDGSTFPEPRPIFCPIRMSRVYGGKLAMPLPFLYWRARRKSVAESSQNRMCSQV